VGLLATLAAGDVQVAGAAVLPAKVVPPDGCRLEGAKAGAGAQEEVETVEGFLGGAKKRL